MDFTNVTKALTARGFKVSSFETAKEAAEYLNSQIDGATVGFGGSITLEELGLYALLSGHNTVFSHWHLPEGGDAASLRAQAAGSEHYLLSANGIAETGEIINIDGAGNRVASAIYGHKKVWIIAGKNKLAPTYDEALWRARNIAAPKNAQRLHAKTPCAVKADHCYDCKSPGRICRAHRALGRDDGQRYGGRARKRGPRLLKAAGRERREKEDTASCRGVVPALLRLRRRAARARVVVGHAAQRRLLGKRR